MLRITFGFPEKWCTDVLCCLFLFRGACLIYWVLWWNETALQIPEEVQWERKKKNEAEKLSQPVFLKICIWMSMSVHLSVQKKNIFFPIITNEGTLSKKDLKKSVYTLGPGWFHWNSGKSKATETLVISVFAQQSSFRHSTPSAPQLSGLEQLSPKPPLCRELRLNLWI